ncbi:MAG: 3-dehydroquinate dehydratase [Clostridia bacterium]|nr:3-dehydroquinate dehydratase [Clostridia bacterium]
MKILVVNGANLNKLGSRDRDIYGDITLDELNCVMEMHVEDKDVELEFFQSNHEGDIIDKLQQTDADALLLNLGAFSHYSYAIRDAVADSELFAVEVHLSDINNREDFRKLRVLEDVVAGVFMGKQKDSYLEALDFIIAVFAQLSRFSL